MLTHMNKIVDLLMELIDQFGAKIDFQTLVSLARFEKGHQWDIYKFENYHRPQNLTFHTSAELSIKETIAEDSKRKRKTKIESLKIRYFWFHIDYC